MFNFRFLLIGIFSGMLATTAGFAQQSAIPHAQDQPPNDPRSAEDAARLMTVPPGFAVEVVASEPDVVNPVAMTIDEKGRFWITESLEYPRRSPGVGKDRVKILEDTDGDGRADRVSLFLDGLNIPSGIQVGYGGVWIVNAPDLLFVPDADRDGVPDGPAEVVVTGFGRTDTHELPNSLTWGPDGWLYGLNGVFNYSHVKYGTQNPNFQEDHPGWKFTCAMFRLHPRTREFEIFCEGTSNPWGIAFNDEGDAFVSACVIDHLWHLVESGYYHRQGGPYPPQTWKIDSIVQHKHQKAAYCGITWLDSEAYPAKYRNKLYMGNIHGGCINVDRIERNGSTYAGFGEPDFLTANDAWFMPVVQKVGPDGCLYVLDWYDRYHCYQDANRDPEGIDRLKGRLYRVRYQETPRQFGFDLGSESDDRLIELLGHPNIWKRETAQRLLTERNSDEAMRRLASILADPAQPFVRRQHAMWAILSLPPASSSAATWNAHLLELARQEQQSGRHNQADFFAAWAFRSAGESRDDLDALSQHELAALIEKSSPPVLLQIAISLGKTPFVENRDQQWLNLLHRAQEDPLLCRIIWQNLLHPRHGEPQQMSHFLLAPELLQSPQTEEFVSRLIDFLLAQPEIPAEQLAQALAVQKQHHQPGLLRKIAGRVQSGELAGQRLAQLRETLRAEVADLLAKPDAPLFVDAALLATSWKDSAGYQAAGTVLASATFQDDQRLNAANALVSAGQLSVLESLDAIFAQDPPVSAEFRGKLLAALGRLNDPQVASWALMTYSQVEPSLQSQIGELLSQRPDWAKALLAAIGEKQIPPSVININQARRLKEIPDPELQKLLVTHWGQVREGRSRDREQVIADMRRLIRTTPGDEQRGQQVYKKICAQCHKIYGEGAEVGPDITLNGRNDYTQLLSNVFDPSLVIGSGYRSYTVATHDGRVINGLLAEDSPQRVVLKVQGGKQEIIARDEIDVLKVNEISLMPEGIEKQYSPQEIADLFAFLTLDKPPTDPTAKRLAGVYSVVPRQSSNPQEFAGLFQEVAPGFTMVNSGEGGVALLAEHLGRSPVVRTHPLSRDRAAVMVREITLPADRKARLEVDVSHDPRGDWRLQVRVGGDGRLIDELVSQSTTKEGWATFSTSLEKYAGKTIKLELLNQANNWSYEFAYWGRVEIVFGE